MSDPDELAVGTYRLISDNFASYGFVTVRAEGSPVTIEVCDSPNGNWAIFRRDGKRIWECNADYAKAHFAVKRIGKRKKKAKTRSK